jgi:hypothetical protein
VVPEDVLLGDNAEKAAAVGDQSLPQPQLSEHVHHCLHRSLSRDCLKNGKKIINIIAARRDKYRFSVGKEYMVKYSD